MGTQSQIYAGAFADPVFAAQSVFRTLMDSFARPGTIGTSDGRHERKVRGNPSGRRRR